MPSSPSGTTAPPARHDLQSALDHTFADPALLVQALTHSSTARDARGRRQTNERLEFLGDRVLGLVVADMLYRHFGDEEEGALARRHAALVQRDSLARVARTVGLDLHLVLSRGERDGGGRDNPGILADCCEAVIAALYLDGGLAVADCFVRRHWAPLMAEDPTPPKDAKTALQEWAQARGLPLPVYEELSREGPPHAPVFTVRVTVEGQVPQEAQGASKRAAERAAAEGQLERLGITV